MRHLQRHKLEREPPNLLEFQEMGDRLATLFECSLNFGKRSITSRYTMDAHWKNKPMLTLLEIRLWTRACSYFYTRQEQAW